ncbi:MAG: class I SAM-dependent methyltransferase [Nitrososphaerota archaeon]
MAVRLQWHIPEEVESFISELIQKVSPVSVLDVGCGNGRFTPLLSDYGRRKYLGVDVSKLKLRIAKRCFPYAEFINADFFSLNLKETFSLVFTACFICLPEVRVKLDLLAEKIYNLGRHFLCFEGFLGLKEPIPSIFERHGFEEISSMRFNQHDADVFLFRRKSFE